MLLLLHTTTALFPYYQSACSQHSPPTHFFSHESRRAVLSTAASAFLAPCVANLLPLQATAMVGSKNPANNYYFPMAKYRYLPRIYRAWLVVEQLGPEALMERNWEKMDVAFYRMDDAVTAMPLYTSAVEGSRSSKKKKKSGVQKEMLSLTKVYSKACGKLEKAIVRKDVDAASTAMQEAREALARYRMLAKIDGDDGGVLDPETFRSKSGSKVTGTGYVVPVFRGGADGIGITEDFYTLDKKSAKKTSQLTE